MKTLKLVEPFNYTYRVLNRISRFTHGDFASVQDAICFVWKQPYRWRNSFESQTFSDGITKRLEIFDFNGIISVIQQNRQEPGRYAIIEVESGRALTKKEIDDGIKLIPNRYKTRTWKDDEGWANRIFTKKNLKKIKKHFAGELYSGRLDYYGDWNEPSYTSPCTLRRRVKTRNEIRQVDGIEREYRNEYNLVRGKRRNVPNAWDDIRSGAWDGRDSWKKNSKRERQWIPKG